LDEEQLNAVLSRPQLHDLQRELAAIVHEIAVHQMAARDSARMGESAALTLAQHAAPPQVPSASQDGARRFPVPIRLSGAAHLKP
jgi:hypothetical protein